MRSTDCSSCRAAFPAHDPDLPSLGIGALLNALAMDVTKVFGTGGDKQLLADIKAVSPGRIEAPAGPGWA